MTQPIRTRTFGGVKYNANQFTLSKLPHGKFQLTAKTGETIIFGQQPEYVHGRKTHPKIELKVDDGLLYDDNKFSLTDIMGAKFTSSEKAVSKVTLKNCEDTSVNLAANKSSWWGDEALIDGGKNNTVILDDNDHARINGTNVEGKGIADQKDY